MPILMPCDPPRRALPPRARWQRSVLPIVLIMSCLALSPAILEAKDPAKTIEARAQDLESIQQTVKVIGEELVKDHADRRALLEELETREREVAAAVVKSRELARAIETQTRVAEALRARQIEEHHLLARELGVWADLIRTAYVMGRADRLRLLLNQEDTFRATRILSYFAYLNRDQARRVTAIQSRTERLTQLARDAQREATQLIELGQQQQAALQQLELARAERAEVLRRLEESIASRTLDLRSLERDAESLRRLVEHLRQGAQIHTELEIKRDPFPKRKGRLGWPLLEGRVLAGFGTPKRGSDLRWDGVLLAARDGEEVRAIHEGRVVHADWLRGFGLLLVIDHGGGFMSIYGHNQALLKEPGEWVGADEVIALSGDSGGREEPVLYFAIRNNGKPEDPASWCGPDTREGRRAHPAERATIVWWNDSLMTRSKHIQGVG